MQVVDRNTRYRNMAVDEETIVCYGRVEQILTFEVHSGGDEQFENLALALIRSAKVQQSVRASNVLYFKQSDYSALEVINIKSIKCTVGRYRRGNKDYILDCTQYSDAISQDLSVAD